jgi:hypothetical protein
VVGGESLFGRTATAAPPPLRTRASALLRHVTGDGEVRANDAGDYLEYVRTRRFTGRFGPYEVHLYRSR